MSAPHVVQKWHGSVNTVRHRGQTYLGSELGDTAEREGIT
jgi:hypothetical protein